MTTRIFQASTLYGAATLAAALDAGCFDSTGRRILLVCNNAATPETTPGLDSMPGFARLRDRFDDVVSYNETFIPFHPGGWSPRADELPLWERFVRHEWRLGDDDVELAVESIQVDPSLTLARIFTGAPVTVYADGLMSYGPTRNKIDPLVGTRVDRVLHVDLVPGLAPLLLTEFGVPAEVVPAPALTKVLASLADGADGLPDVEEPALLLGQYLSALGILSPDEEDALHLRMLRGVVALGHERVVFKPHPSAPARFTRSLEEEAGRLGAELVVCDTPVLAEVLFQRTRPALVAGCFSTALLTASALYGLPVARVGTDLLLERLTPYENSNRVPVTIVDALLPALEDPAAVAERRPGKDVEALGALVRAVGFAMQPKILPGLRAETERYLAAHQDEGTLRYFKRRRLTSLGLPGGLPAQLSFIPRNATVRRVARRARDLRRSAREGAS